MTAAAGRVLILLALLVSSAGAVAGFAAGARGSAAGWRLTRGLAYAFAALMAAANALMVWALVTRDFSVGYVAHVGSRRIPDWVAVVSLWSSLEGSILFWGLVLGVYVTAATRANRDRHPEYMPYAAAVWLAASHSASTLMAPSTLASSRPVRSKCPVRNAARSPRPHAAARAAASPIASGDGSIPIRRTRAARAMKSPGPPGPQPRSASSPSGGSSSASQIESSSARVTSECGSASAG